MVHNVFAHFGSSCALDDVVLRPHLTQVAVSVCKRNMLLNSTVCIYVSRSQTLAIMTFKSSEVHIGYIYILLFFCKDKNHLVSLNIK